MKNLISVLLISLVPTSIFAIGGFGLQLGQGSFSVDASSPDTNIPGVTLTNGAFDGSGVLGGYVYFDLIPFVDIEFDFNVQANTYDIEFQNAFGEMPKINFACDGSGNLQGNQCVVIKTMKYQYYKQWHILQLFPPTMD